MGRGSPGARQPEATPAVVPVHDAYPQPHDMVLGGGGALHYLPSGTGLLWDAPGRVIPFVYGRTKCWDLHAGELPDECEHQRTFDLLQGESGPRSDGERLSFFGTLADGGLVIGHKDAPEVAFVLRARAPTGWQYRLCWPALSEDGVRTVIEEGGFSEHELPPAKTAALARALAYLALSVMWPEQR